MDEEARLELVRDWLMRARRDLEAARALAALSEPLLDSAIYHCQQAAEKALKGWLQMQDDPFPKTHDIERLVRQAALQEPEFNQHLQAAAVLTPFFGVPLPWRTGLLSPGQLFGEDRLGQNVSAFSALGGNSSAWLPARSASGSR